MLALSVKINSTCNIACSYCYERKFQDSTGDMSIKNFEYLNNCLKLCNDDLVVCIQGGEPTLHKDLLYFLNTLHENEKVKKIYLNI